MAVPNIVRTYSFCPVTCTLTELTSSGIDPNIIKFTPSTGSFTINTNNKALHNVSTNWSLACRPVYNTQEPVSTFTFSLKFYDECYDTYLSPAWSAGVDTSLFLETSIPYTPSYSTKACGSITYSLNLVSSDGNDPTFQLTNSFSVYIYGTDPINHIGSHLLKIKSCIQVFDKGVSIVCANCCSDSDIFTVNMIDPCFSSTIQTSTVPSTLSA